MNRMGGLWRRIPVTHLTMLIGSIAIAGIPPLAGFFSKDEILAQAWKNGFVWVWAIGILVALMTAFYMFRLMGKTFYGPSNVDPAVEPRIHESPPSMTLPLIILAIPSLLLGVMLGFPIGAGLIDQWMEPVFHGANEVLGHGAHEPFQLLGLDGLLAGASVAVAVLGVFAAMRLFGFRVPLLGLEAKPRPEAIRRLTDRARPLYRGSFHKWFFDDLNDLIFVRFGGLLARALWWFDVHVIDGAVNGIAGFTQRSGRGLRQIQTGRVQNYALGIALSLIVVAVGYFVTGGR